ncbi:hypothetical protein [Variovorax sp. ZT4R33]|uniref:hypothetical protein n=1 Tax=Variovorax sp. ZT4R33 TaxID=3443743 RepID=UPI003F44D7CA
MSNPPSNDLLTRPSRRNRALAAFPWVLLACALALFGFAAYIALRYAEAASGAAGPAAGGLWGQFGFLMGGILGPALGFLTVVGLAMTLLMQLNAAGEARHDAETLRQEAELRGRQAFLGTKLAALTTLVDAANHEIYRSGGSVEQRQLWEDRKRSLLAEMDATFAILQALDPQPQPAAPVEGTAAA